MNEEESYIDFKKNKPVDQDFIDSIVETAKLYDVDKDGYLTDNGRRITLAELFEQILVQEI